MSELKPCPNPRCAKRELRKGASYSQNWRIECGSCGMSGPLAGTYELASERWNQLVDDMSALTPERVDELWRQVKSETICDSFYFESGNSLVKLLKEEMKMEK